MHSSNRAIVLEAFNAAFNRREPDALDRYWSPDYVQHSAHIPPGREGLRKLIATSPSSMRHEPGLIMAEGDLVMVHGRYSGLPGPSWVVVDIVRIVDGRLAEHWDVIQDEATREMSKSGLPMFGEVFPDR